MAHDILLGKTQKNWARGRGNPKLADGSKSPRKPDPFETPPPASPPRKSDPFSDVSLPTLPKKPSPF